MSGHLYGFYDVAIVTDIDGTVSLTPGVPVVQTTPLNQTLALNFITDTDTFYVPSISQTGGIGTLTPSLVIDGDSFYVPAVVAGVVTIAPSLYPDNDAFHAPARSSTVTITPSLYTDLDTFHVPVITVGPKVLTPGLVTDADAFYAPSVSLDLRYIDPDIFYPFVSTVPVIPIWYRETDSIHTPSISILTVLLPPAFNAVDTFYAPRLGEIFLYPGFVTDLDTIPATTVNYVSPNLKPPFFNADAVIYTPTTVTRANTLAPSLAADADIFRVPNILRGSVTLRPSRVIDPDIFLSPIVGIIQVSDNPPGGDPANLPGNLKYVSKYVIAQSGLILSMDLQSSSTKTINTRMVIYRDTAGVPGLLAGVTADKTSVVTGINHYTLIAPVSVLAGDNIWMGLHSDGNFNWFLSNAPGGSRWNTDTWVGGASDPFGPVNIDNKKAPIVVYYLQSSNAAITVDTVIDLDAFYAPVLVSSKILNPPLITEEFFYTPLVRSQWTLTPNLVTDSDTFYAPVLTTKTTLQPSRVIDADVVYSPFLAKFAPTVFSAAMPHDDMIYSPMVEDFGAILFPQRVVDTDLLYLPQRSGSIGMTPSLVALGDVFYAPVLSRGAVSIAPPVVDSEIDFYLPVVSTYGGAAMIRPDPYIDPDVFYRPRKSGNPGWRRQIYITGTEADEISIVGTVPVPELVE